MSVVTDKVRKFVDDSIDEQKEKLESRVDSAISLYRNGSEEATKVVNEVEEKLDKVESLKDKISDAIENIKNVKLSLDAGRKAAEATEKASSISSALNPAAAAIAYAQKFIIDRLKIEIKDIGDEVNVLPKIIENLDSFIKSTKAKLAKEKERAETKKRLRERNRKMLT